MPKWPLHTVFLMLGIALAGSTLLVLRFDQVLQYEKRDGLIQFVGGEVAVEGVVTNNPERRETSLHVYVHTKEVDGVLVEGTFLAILPRDTSIFYGDKVVLRGKLSLPENFETDAGREFDYKNYLRVRGINTLMRYGEVERVESGGLSVRKNLYSLKHSFERSLEKIFPEPHVSLLEGILLGARRGIPDDLTNAFVISGLIHVVVLSGYNISIVAEAMLRALSFLPRTVGFVAGATMMILFAVMTGAGATTVRATIMGLIAILARYFHRPTAALRALGVVAVVMVLWNPLSLIYDVSFILSVLATFGLITLSPWVETWLPKFFDRVPSIKSIAASTVAVQIFILPALLYFTGILSFVSFPANILVLPVIPLVMFLGFISGLLGFVHPVLALLPAVLATVLLEWTIRIATVAASFPFSATVVTEFPVWVAVAAYVPLTWFAVIAYRKNVSQLRSNLDS